MSTQAGEQRKPNYEISPLLYNRWSPRAFDASEMPDAELMALFEAARWAPSASNRQPWRFVYAKRETPEWQPIFDLLDDFNKDWCINASVLVVVVARTTGEHTGKFNRTHSYDTGAAWENLALEATARGWVAHGMAGFDYDKAKQVLEVPEEHEVQAMISIGKLTDKSVLPESLQEKETPSDRRPLEEIVIHGKFKK